MPLHPQSREFLADLEQQNLPGWHQLKPHVARQLFARAEEKFGPPPSVEIVQDLEIENGLKLRLYRANNRDETLPAIMFFHGGGWVLGDLETHDVVCRHLAIQTGYPVIAVDYRLAPDHPFPAATEDCFAATQYMATHAEQFQIDPQQLIVCGDSAGGNLAVSVALQALETDQFEIAAQLLFYPVITPDFASGSYLEFSEKHGLTTATMKWFWDNYIPTVEDRTDPLADPSRSNQLSQLPPTCIVLAEYDVLWTEGEQFASQLKDAGVEVDVTTYPGMLHGFVHFLGMFDDGLTAIEEGAEFLQGVVNS